MSKIEEHAGIQIPIYYYEDDNGMYVSDYDNYGLVNSSGKHINHKEFEKQMEYIANRTNIISLDEFLEIKSNSKPLPPKTTIVTFDDGFKNNLTVAAPILEKYQIKC